MDNDCAWICDYCAAYMNNQPGFNVSDGTWTCSECGTVNDVSENNIVDPLALLAYGIDEITSKLFHDSDDDY